MSIDYGIYYTTRMQKLFIALCRIDSTKSIDLDAQEYFVHHIEIHIKLLTYIEQQDCRQTYDGVTAAFNIYEMHIDNTYNLL